MRKHEQEYGWLAAVAAGLGALWLLKKYSAAPASHPTPGAFAVSNGTEHPARLTQLSSTQARDIMRKAWTEYFTAPVSLNQLAMALAHTALETGRWKKMYCNNWGFVTTAGSLDYFMIPGNPLKFRFYQDPLTGAKDYLQFMFQHMNSAYELMGSDDPHAYVHQLKLHNYFGDGDESTYANAVAAMYAEFKNWLSVEPPPVSGLPPWPSGWTLARLTPEIISDAKLMLRTLQPNEHRTEVMTDGRLIQFVKQRTNGKTVVTAWEVRDSAV